ncbi:hypothetical protein HYH02_007260 [Chlamydomonas schloesseri]|uniref:Uncharacterized protein n=1 Tax=Chlamydomonas schloesseri TaxID=2026947 RepID=A0A836B592_9CHLO|nr:hypothetical protein HYH02_007260 [Chlamydomonas schloesseri]|eukprot:KAG2447803.1 hypothetical protein HYH02_007260 [Chlamydomonas schloesseri]
MDALREHLEKPQDGQAGFIASVLNWLSQNGFGGLTEPRGLAALYRWFLNLVPSNVHRIRPARPHVWHPPPELVSQARSSPLPGLLLVAPESLAKVAVDVPDVLAMSSEEAVGRLTGLKALLPVIDVSHLIITEPRFYLGTPRTEVEARVAGYVELLVQRYKLPTSLVQEMVWYDPGLPLVANDKGMRELRALWPEDLVDEAAWEQSDPRELALAVRALSTRLR